MGAGVLWLLSLKKLGCHGVRSCDVGLVLASFDVGAYLVL